MTISNKSISPKIFLNLNFRMILMDVVYSFDDCAWKNVNIWQHWRSAVSHLIHAIYRLKPELRTGIQLGPITIVPSAPSANHSVTWLSLSGLNLFTCFLLVKLARWKNMRSWTRFCFFLRPEFSRLLAPELKIPFYARQKAWQQDTWETILVRNYIDFKP